MKDVSEVVVNGEVIDGSAQPLFIYAEDPTLTGAAS